MKLVELITVLQDMIVKNPDYTHLEVVIEGYEGGFNSVIMAKQRYVSPFANEEQYYGQHGNPDIEADPHDHCEPAIELVGAHVAKSEAF